MQTEIAPQVDRDFFDAVLNAFPSPVFLLNEDMTVIAKNGAATLLFGSAADHVLRMTTGQVLHCVNANDTASGCGHGRDCKGCVVRDSVRSAIDGHRAMRKRCRIRVAQGATDKEILLLVTTSPFQVSGRSLVLLVLEDMSELAELKALIPICAGCKKIRDDKAFWHHVEAYLQDHLDLQFSHGLCPDCVSRLYPQMRATGS